MLMKYKFSLFQRSNGIFFIQDNATGRQESLRTRDKTKAQSFFKAKNEAHQPPALNLHIVKAYLAAADSSFAKRTWREVMAEFVKTKAVCNHTRFKHIIADKAFDSIRDLQLLETRPEHFLRVLQEGKVFSNNYLRRLHNFAVDRGWLPWPVLPKKRWPASTSASWLDMCAALQASVPPVVFPEGKPHENDFPSARLSNWKANVPD